jgi:hypothetical protein
MALRFVCFAFVCTVGAARAQPAPHLQVYSFAELRWGADRSSVQRALAAQGFSFVRRDEEGDLNFRGRAMSHDAHVLAIFGRGRLVKVAVEIGARSQATAQDLFAELRRDLAEKYGKSNSDPGPLEEALGIQPNTTSAVWATEFGTHHEYMVLDLSATNVVVAYESGDWPGELKRRRQQNIRVF